MSDPETETTSRGFWVQLRRRGVIRAAIVYAVVGWVVIEVASVVLPALNLPAWSVKLVIVLVALGFPMAIIMGWMYDLSPRGSAPNPANRSAATAARRARRSPRSRPRGLWRLPRSKPPGSRRPPIRTAARSRCCLSST